MLDVSGGSPIERQSADNYLSEPVSSLSVELKRISAEIQSINAGFQTQLQLAILNTHDAMERHYRLRFETAVVQAQKDLREEITRKVREEFEIELEKRVRRFAQVRGEIERVSARLAETNAEIQALLNDQGSELSKVIRKRAEQVELQSYLRGLHFAAGEKT
jgi:hypothetical protein